MEGRAKAVIAQLEGNSVALQAERTYVRSLLATAVGRELRRAGAGQFGALARAWAIGIGLLVTTVTYSRTRAAQVAGRIFGRMTH